MRKILRIIGAWLIRLSFVGEKEVLAIKSNGDPYRLPASIKPSKKQKRAKKVSAYYPKRSKCK